ncbi:MAG: MarR family transcriptional regulator [Pseudomonas sp.]|nr:MarR family transcriptional regulator [Pseudomonas sp.]
MVDNSAVDSIDYGVLGELIGYRLRRAQLAYFSRFANFRGDWGVSLGLFGVLEIVNKNPGLTQTAVAQALGNDRSAMVAIIDKLEKMKLVERRQSELDRRSYALYLTPEGKKCCQEITLKVIESETSFESKLKPGDKERLMEILKCLPS